VLYYRAPYCQIFILDGYFKSHVTKTVVLTYVIQVHRSQKSSTVIVVVVVVIIIIIIIAAAAAATTTTNNTQSVLRQVHSLFQNDFFTECDPVLPPPLSPRFLKVIQ
jgi:ABC-type transport system involved in cytochrome bd biosynthesis fused ATPase/permease subunit